MGRVFVIIDGLDGIGKGEMESAIRDYELSKGTRILDLKDFWREHNRHPEIDEIKDYDMIISAEPTRVWIGASIKAEITADNKRDYSALATAQAFALDRFVLMKRVILPALERGIKVLQSRSFVSSLVYQQVQAKEQGGVFSVDEILGLEGNSFELNSKPTLFMIPTIKDPAEVMRRLGGREKDDKCEFENLEFQTKVKPLYESSWLKELLESKGSKVEYPDVSISIEHSRKQAVDLWKKYTE